MAGLLGREDYFNVHFLREQWERDKQEEGAKWLCRAGLTPRGLSGVKDRSLMAQQKTRAYKTNC